MWFTHAGGGMKAKNREPMEVLALIIRAWASVPQALPLFPPSHSDAQLGQAVEPTTCLRPTAPTWTQNRSSAIGVCIVGSHLPQLEKTAG
jgi:hypothetical protein